MRNENKDQLGVNFDTVYENNRELASHSPSKKTLTIGDGVDGNTFRTSIAISDEQISDMKRRADRLRLSIAALAGAMFAAADAFASSCSGLNAHSFKYDVHPAKPIGHLFGHAPIFTDSGSHWRELQYVHSLVAPRNQSRKDLAKNANRYNHTQRRNLKRDIINAIKKK